MESQKESQIPPPPPWPHKTPPRIEILLQIYQGTFDQLRKRINFQLYQDLLGQGVHEQPKKLEDTYVGKEEARYTAMTKLEVSPTTRYDHTT